MDHVQGYLKANFDCLIEENLHNFPQKKINPSILQILIWNYEQDRTLFFFKTHNSLFCLKNYIRNTKRTFRFQNSLFYRLCWNLFKYNFSLSTAFVYDVRSKNLDTLGSDCQFREPQLSINPAKPNFVAGLVNNYRNYYICNFGVFSWTQVIEKDTNSQFYTRKYYSLDFTT